MLKLDGYYVLKKSTIIRNDKKRVIMYHKYSSFYEKLKSKNQTNHLTLDPILSICFSLFDGTRKLNTILNFIKDYFKLSEESMDKYKNYIIEFDDYYIINDSPKQTRKLSIKNILPKIVNLKDFDLIPNYTYYPTTLLFLPTMECVVNCNYCYAQKKHAYSPMDYSIVEKYGKEIDKYLG